MYTISRLGRYEYRRVRFIPFSTSLYKRYSFSREQESSRIGIVILKWESTVLLKVPLRSTTPCATLNRVTFMGHLFKDIGCFERQGADDPRTYFQNYGRLCHRFCIHAVIHAARILFLRMTQTPRKISRIVPDTSTNKKEFIINRQKGISR